MDLKEIRREERVQQSARRREQMVAVAFDCFCRQGLWNTTIADIAGEAGFGEATIYRYFSTKENLALECGVRFWEFTREFFEKLTLEKTFAQKSGMEQTEILMRGALEFFRKETDAFRLIYHLDLILMSCKIEEEKLQAYEQAVDGMREYLWESIEKGKKDCSISRMESTEELYYGLTNGIFGMMQKQAAAGNLLDTDAKVDSIKKTEVLIELLIEGLRGEKG